MFCKKMGSELFADLTVTGITDNDEKVSVITMRFPLRRVKIKNL